MLVPSHSGLYKGICTYTGVHDKLVIMCTHWCDLVGHCDYESDGSYNLSEAALLCMYFDYASFTTPCRSSVLLDLWLDLELQMEALSI